MLSQARSRWFATALVGATIGLTASTAWPQSPWVDPPTDASAPPAPTAGGPGEVQPAPPRASVPADGQSPLAAAPADSEPSVEPADPTRVPADPAATAVPAPVPRSVRPKPERAPERRAPAVRSAGQSVPSDRDTAARMSAARELAVEYLNSWSAPNAEALSSAPAFYAPRVVFHGRAMSIRDLLEQKRRFAQRWPERRYRPLPDTTGVVCEADGASCTVRSVFEFAAANPRRGRRSQGIATLELVLSFAGDRPVITAESSLVHGRGRGDRQLGLEGHSDG